MQCSDDTCWCAYPENEIEIPYTRVGHHRAGTLPDCFDHVTTIGCFFIMFLLPQHMNHVSLLFEVIITVLSTTDLAWMYPTVDAVFVRMDNWMIPLV